MSVGRLQLLNPTKAAYVKLLPLNKLAGQEGLEPPTNGFGDRRSTNWSYWPVHIPKRLTSLTVRGVTSTPAAILLELDTIGVILLVLLGRVVTALALRTRQGNHRTHLKTPCALVNVRHSS